MRIILTLHEEVRKVFYEQDLQTTIYTYKMHQITVYSGSRLIEWKYIQNQDFE